MNMHTIAKLSANYPSQHFTTCRCGCESQQDVSSTQLTTPVLLRRAIVLSLTVKGAIGALSLIPAAVLANDELLDPSFLQNRGAKYPSVSSLRSLDARSMADAVVSSLDYVTRKAAEFMADVAKLDGQISDMNAKLARLDDEMQSVLFEYRQGLFCSGCGKTKSEILKVGDTFPHAGQTIVRATPEQIRDKTVQMQSPIDRANKELTDLRGRRVRMIESREEALDQINCGINLWTTAITFEKNIIQTQEGVSLRRYQGDLAEIDRQVAALVARPKKVPSEEAAFQSKLTSLGASKTELNSRRVREQREYVAQIAKASERASQNETRLNEFLDRGMLGRNSTVFAKVSFVSPSLGFSALGGYYRMGSIDLAGHDQILPNVQQFVSQFQSTPLPIVPTATEPGTQQKIIDHLHDLLKCNPDLDKGCDKNLINGGPGLRG